MNTQDTTKLIQTSDSTINSGSGGQTPKFRLYTAKFIQNPLVRTHNYFWPHTLKLIQNPELRPYTAKLIQSKMTAHTQLIQIP